MPLISVRTFGPVGLLVDGGEAPPGLRWRKHTALLVYLILSPRHTRMRSHLLGLLWGDKSEPAARHSLNEALRMLRKSAGEQAIRAESGHEYEHPRGEHQPEGGVGTQIPVHKTERSGPEIRTPGGQACVA